MTYYATQEERLAAQQASKRKSDNEFLSKSGSKEAIKRKRKIHNAKPEIKKAIKKRQKALRAKPATKKEEDQ